jgi:hypothetical protein
MIPSAEQRRREQEERERSSRAPLPPVISPSPAAPALPPMPTGPAGPLPPTRVNYGSSAAARSAAVGGAETFNARSVEVAEDIRPSGRLERVGQFITSTLSPIQAPQDILYATAAGLLDRNRSVMDYLGDLEWQNYTFWTEAPLRPIDGNRLLNMLDERVPGATREIVSGTLSGMRGMPVASAAAQAALQYVTPETDDVARQVLGFGLDLFADPLMGGATLRAAAKMTSLGSLNRVADAMDTVAESTMLVGALPTFRVAGAARSLPGFKAIESSIMNNFVGKFLMPLANAALKPLGGLEGAAARSLPFRPGGKEFNLAGMFAVDGGRLPGAQPVVSRAGALVDELQENTAVLLMGADAAAGGNTWKHMLRNMQQGLAVMYDIPVGAISRLPAELTQAMLGSAYSTASDLGYTLGRTIGVADKPAITGGASPEMLRAARELDEIESVSGRIAPRAGASAQQDAAQRVQHYQSERSRIEGLAARYGEDPGTVAGLYDNVVGRFLQVGAIEGYFASGYGPMRDKFTREMSERLANLTVTNPRLANAIQLAGGEASVIANAWSSVIRSGPLGTAKDILDTAVNFRGSHFIQASQRFTYRQLFGDYGKIPGLDLGVYVDSLTKGHMRRTFGIFQDEDSWKVALDRLKDGRIASNRILNEPVVIQGLNNTGFGAEASMLTSYLNDVVPKMFKNRPAGAFVRQADIMTHMIKTQNVTPQRAQEFWRQLMREQDPLVADLADRMEVYGRKHGGTVDPSQVLNTPRQNLSQPELETLIEIMNPILSATETSAASMTSTRRTQALTGIMQLAEKQGLIVDAERAPGMGIPRWWVNIDEKKSQLLPMLAGKSVHPMVYREFHNVMNLSPQDGSWVSNLRSMVTAGYLASPATTAANVAGGFWTAALHGINPVKLMGNMAEVYRDWRRMGRDLPELAHARDLVQSGISQNDLIRMSRDIPDGITRDLRSGIQIMSDALRSGVDAYNQVLRRPLGARASGALGLGLFETTEALFRLGTFRMVMKETGGDIEEARKMARFVVFDYAAQPGAVQVARNSGLFLFPAFPYFMVGRTINAARTRPGMLAAAERVPDVATRMMFNNEDERRQYLAGLEDYQVTDKFIPIRRKENGDVTVLPFNQLFPTVTLTGAPFMDSLMSAGLFGPAADFVNAIGGLFAPDREGADPGEGPFTGRFGRRVLPTGVQNFDDPGEVARGLSSFLYNSFAPAFARKAARAPEDFNQQWEGLIPQILRSTVDVPREYADTGRTVRELSRQRANQDLLDASISFGLRSTSIVSTRGPTMSAVRLLERATRAHVAERQRIESRIQQLELEGNQRQVDEKRMQLAKLDSRYRARWGDTINLIRDMAGSGELQLR